MHKKPHGIPTLELMAVDQAFKDLDTVINSLNIKIKFINIAVDNQPVGCRATIVRINLVSFKRKLKTFKCSKHKF